jgi:hypothetical protein
MKNFGPLYGGKLQYWHKKALPIVEIGSTTEAEFPYRLGKCLVFRVPFTHPGYYFGLWVKKTNIHPDDEDAIDALLSEAMKGRKAWEPEDGFFDEVFFTE